MFRAGAEPHCVEAIACNVGLCPTPRKGARPLDPIFGEAGGYMLALRKAAQAGTLESSDMLVSVAPANAGAGIQLELVSSTMQQYGEHIKKLISSIFADLGVADAVVQANDKGAVDCVIEARVKTAILRAAE